MFCQCLIRIYKLSCAKCWRKWSIMFCLNFWNKISCKRAVWEGTAGGAMICLTDFTTTGALQQVILSKRDINTRWKAAQNINIHSGDTREQYERISVPYWTEQPSTWREANGALHVHFLGYCGVIGANFMPFSDCDVWYDESKAARQKFSKVPEYVRRCIGGKASTMSVV